MKGWEQRKEEGKGKGEGCGRSVERGIWRWKEWTSQRIGREVEEVEDAY